MKTIYLKPYEKIENITLVGPMTVYLNKGTRINGCKLYDVTIMPVPGDKTFYGHDVPEVTKCQFVGSFSWITSCARGHESIRIDGHNLQE